MSALKLMEGRAGVAAAAPGPCPVIETRRLVLRPQRLGDADSMVETLADFEVAKMLATFPRPLHRADALDWLVPRTSGTLPDWHFAITRDDDTSIGAVSLEAKNGAWQLAYWLNRFYWRRGYMGEAVFAVLDRFFRRVPDAGLEALVFADNAAALRLQQKLGFRLTGCRPLYSLSRAAMAPALAMRLRGEDLVRPGR